MFEFFTSFVHYGIMQVDFSLLFDLIDMLEFRTTLLINITVKVMLY